MGSLEKLADLHSIPVHELIFDVAVGEMKNLWGLRYLNQPILW